METSKNLWNYERITKAITFIIQQQSSQPNLDEIAAHVNLSSFHFQRLFQEWVGTSPKQFLQYLNLSYAKKILKDNKSILSTSTQIGLSSSSRLHELFVKIEAMTPAEFKNSGQSLNISYSIQESPFGQIVIASTAKGICQISFIENKKEALKTLENQFANANYNKQVQSSHLEVLKIFNASYQYHKPISVHLKGTNFQLKVWEALLKIPFGNLQTYGTIAASIKQPTASRAVGTAIGSNPLAYLIPCHRVIQASGIIGGYMWNPIRKNAIIGWEAVNIENAIPSI